MADGAAWVRFAGLGMERGPGGRMEESGAELDRKRDAREDFGSGPGSGSAERDVGGGVVGRTGVRVD